MRRIHAGAFVSLDGVMQAPGGPEEDPTGGFTHGGWVAPYWDDTAGESMAPLFEEPFDLLLGAVLTWLARPKRRPKTAPGQELVPAQATAGGAGPAGGR